MKKQLIFYIFTLFFLLQWPALIAQDNRGQYPVFLQKSYYEVHLGYIDYPFTNDHLEPGYTAAEINVPHIAPRFIFGYNFNSYVSAQISYLRPVMWVNYYDINGDMEYHSIFTNVGGISVKAGLPLKGRLGIFGEGGFALISRKGFLDYNQAEQPYIINDIVYGTYMLGGGLNYRINNKWKLMLSGIYSPPNDQKKQPYTVYYSGGFTLTMDPLSEEKVKHNNSGGYIFPRRMVQLGYTTNAFGYGINSFVSEGTIPIFWGGKAKVKQGIAIHYTENVYHRRKVFAFDLGLSFSYFSTSEQSEEFWTLSAFPIFRFTVLRTRPLDLYLNYSVAGPSFISKEDLDGYKTGPKFTFQDLMGMGVFVGKNREINAELRIGHYSNGNIFPKNQGVMLPLTFCLGYSGL